MIITSEKTGKEYKTVEECIEAERIYDEQIALKKAEEMKRRDERKKDAETVNAKYEAYISELQAFIKKHGSYHYSVSEADPIINTIFGNFFRH